MHLFSWSVNEQALNVDISLKDLVPPVSSLELLLWPLLMSLLFSCINLEDLVNMRQNDFRSD